MSRTNKANIAQSRVLAAMMIFSVACLFLHLIRPGWGAALNNKFSQLSQPVALLASIAPRAAQPLAATTPEPSESSIERNMTEGQVLALAEEVRTLRQRNTELMGMRSRDYIPPRLGMLIPSQVISRDSLAYRSVATIDRGTQGGAAVDQYVTSAIYLDRGSQDGLKLKRNVFTVESLIGRIIWVGPYTSRVCLLTDPTSRLRVRIARIHPEQPKEPVGLSQDTYTLEGAGSDGMLIKQVDYRQVNSGAIKVGDLVVAEPSADLPQAAVSLRRVGRITAILHSNSQVVYTLKVSPLVNLDSLNHVYIFDPTPVE